MNYRILSVLGVMALMVATWFFYQEDVEIKPAVPVAPTASYEVTEIQAVQTNEETGEKEYTLTAKSLVQNAKGEDEMLGVSMQWQPPQAQKFSLVADKATLDQATGELYLAAGFRLVREATADKPQMTIEGTQLQANTKSREVKSQAPLKITQGDDSFRAASFRANLQTGEYEFDKIEMMFNPPQTKDKPLF